MLTRRIIPCLDVKDGRVVKGVNFIDLIDAGDPVGVARIYNEEGADELVFLDITATEEGRDTICNLVEEVAGQVFIPLTVGGGIRTVEDMKRVLRAGADKVGINSAAVKDPDLITRGAGIFGSQCIVVAVDASMRPDSGGWNVYIHGGKRDAGIDLLEWVEEIEARGAGEILLTSIDADGTKDGFDLEMIQAVTDIAGIPVIASGGAGSIDDFIQVFKETGADAGLAASIFHFGEVEIPLIKNKLAGAGIPVRPVLESRRSGIIDGE